MDAGTHHIAYAKASQVEDNRNRGYRRAQQHSRRLCIHDRSDLKSLLALCLWIVQLHSDPLNHSTLLVRSVDI